MGIEPPSRMKMGCTAVCGAGCCEFPGLEVDASAEASVLAREGSETGVSGDAAACVSVEEVGTAAVAKEDRFFAALPAEEVVAEVMTRSTCDARLSDESLRTRF